MIDHAHLSKRHGRNLLPVITTDTVASHIVCVRSIRRFGGGPGVYEVRWRDGRRHRRALALIEDWVHCDRAVGAAVGAAYRAEVGRPVVYVPDTAWR